MATRVLERRTAVITGASRGIGAAIALTFAREGAEVVLAARSRSDLQVIANRIAAMGGTPYNEPYSSSKAALNHLTRTLACELGPNGLRVNAVIPGPVDTDMTAGFFEGREHLKAYYANLHPLRGWTQAEDCAGPALFLASDAARRVHGHLLVVDGGLSAINQDAFGPPENPL